MAVPEKSHSFREGRRSAEHVIDPPLLQLRDGKASTWSGRRGELRWLNRLRLDQSVDGPVEPVGKGGFELGRGRSKARPA